tara:strand:- start:36 stop:185 length:150 start_codon:yes stop_codon:yes gene_type:complete
VVAVHPVEEVRAVLVAVVLLVGQMAPVIPERMVWVAEQVQQDTQLLVLK